MNKHWVVIVDKKTFEIYKDEKTSEECWEFYSSAPNHDGYGVIAKTREECIKGIVRRYKKELNQLKIELKTKTKNFNKLLDVLKESDNND